MRYRVPISCSSSNASACSSSSYPHFRRVSAAPIRRSASSQPQGTHLGGLHCVHGTHASLFDLAKLQDEYPRHRICTASDRLMPWSHDTNPEHWQLQHRDFSAMCRPALDGGWQPVSLPDPEVTELASLATTAFFANTTAAALRCKAATNPVPVGWPQPTKACSQVDHAP